MDTLIHIPSTPVRVGIVRPPDFFGGGAPQLDTRYDTALIENFRRVRFEGYDPIVPVIPHDTPHITIPSDADMTLCRDEQYDRRTDVADYFDHAGTSEYIVAVSDDEPHTIQIGCRVVFDLLGLPCDSSRIEESPEGSVEITHLYVRGGWCRGHHPAAYLRYFGIAVQRYLNALTAREEIFITYGKRYTPHAGQRTTELLAQLLFAVEHGRQVRSVSLLCTPHSNSAVHGLPTQAFRSH